MYHNGPRDHQMNTYGGQTAQWRQNEGPHLNNPNPSHPNNRGQSWGGGGHFNQFNPRRSTGSQYNGGGHFNGGGGDAQRRGQWHPEQGHRRGQDRNPQFDHGPRTMGNNGNLQGPPPSRPSNATSDTPSPPNRSDSDRYPRAESPRRGRSHSQGRDRKRRPSSHERSRSRDREHRSRERSRSPRRTRRADSRRRSASPARRQRADSRDKDRSPVIDQWVEPHLRNRSPVRKKEELALGPSLSEGSASVRSRRRAEYPERDPTPPGPRLTAVRSWNQSSPEQHSSIGHSDDDDKDQLRIDGRASTSSPIESFPSSDKPPSRSDIQESSFTEPGTNPSSSSSPLLRRTQRPLTDIKDKRATSSRHPRPPVRPLRQ